MNLLCLSDFNQGGYSARAGEVCWFMPDVARWLLDSWPGCWQKIAIPETPRSFGPVETAAIAAPPVDKMIDAPARAKGKRRG